MLSLRWVESNTSERNGKNGHFRVNFTWCPNIDLGGPFDVFFGPAGSMNAPKLCLRASVALAVCALGVSTLARAAELSRSDRRWLEQEVAVIITAKEAQVFRDLDSNQDRKLFKELFWVRRDPNLITIENEFRAELERRMRVANINFRRGRKRGSTTDMGAVFVLLGNPTRKEEIRKEGAGGIPLSSPEVADVVIPSIPGTGNMRTVQWFYEPNSQLGIPEGLELRFQSQPGVGSWLEPSGEVEDALERVRESTIANPGVAYSLDSKGRLRKPPSRFDPRSRAKKVLREMMDHDTLPADISFETEIDFFQAKDGCFIPLLIQIDREHLRWDDQLAQVTAFVSIESVDGRLISYFEEPVALTFPQAGPSDLELPFQLPSGNYTFSLGILDENSKLAGTRQIPVFVPDFDTEELDLSSVLLYTDKSISDEAPGALGRAFQFGNAHFDPIGRRPLRPTDNLGVFFFVYGFGLDDGGQSHLTADYAILEEGKPREPIDGPPIHADPSQAYAEREIPLAGFEPGRYQIEIQVTDHVSNRVVKKRVDFTVEIGAHLVAEYSELVNQYQSGRFDSAADAMSRVPRASIPGAAKAYRRESRRDADLEAAAILHTEVVVTQGIMERAHLRAARAYLEQIEDESHRRILERIHYLVVAYHLRRSPESFGAISILKDALSAFPRDVELRVAVGSVYESAGWLGSKEYLEQAEGLFRGVVEEEPTHAEAHLRLGRVLQIKGEREDAIRELKWSLEYSDDLETDFVAHMLLGGLYRGQGRLSEAVRAYQAAIGIDPACQACTIALSYTLEQLGDPEGSHQVIAELLERSLELPGDTDWWRSYVRGDSERVETLLAELRNQLHP